MPKGYTFSDFSLWLVHDKFFGSFKLTEKLYLLAPFYIVYKTSLKLDLYFRLQSRYQSRRWFYVESLVLANLLCSGQYIHGYLGQYIPGYWVNIYLDIQVNKNWIFRSIYTWIFRSIYTWIFRSIKTGYSGQYIPGYSGQ